MTMGTAATMMALVETLGFTLPGASSILAADSAHGRMASASGRRIVEIAERLGANVVRIDARDAGTLLLSGLGAGGAASASPILGDLVTLLREPKSTMPRFEPAIEIAPLHDGLQRLDELPEYPLWDDSLLNPVEQALR